VVYNLCANHIAVITAPIVAKVRTIICHKVIPSGDGVVRYWKTLFTKDAKLINIIISPF
jgi:hypothetical protein